MKILIQLIILPLLVSLGSAASIPQLATKPVLFTVKDHSGKPVPDALVEASLPGPGNASASTDASGEAVLDLSAGATLHVHVSKDGYYATSGEIWIGGIYRNEDGRIIARELPDSLEITLKPIIDPVPMKVTRYRGHIPKVNKMIGFDLERGDWLEPHGTGRVPDLLFHLHMDKGKAESSGLLTILFPNKGDGVQPFQAARPYSTEFGSNLAPPHVAPLNGYRPNLTRSFEEEAAESFKQGVRSSRNYLIRTRTIIDAGGTIRQACYGWLEGEVLFDPRDPEDPQLSFTAFFNPDPHPDARSLERLDGSNGQRD
ncbi:MAG: carboxypeptidase-like regulatory domain-containing protein [Puniceicoccaceae bacterium]